MAADAGDVATLARKLRAKGATDEQVIEGLRGMGYSATEAKAAVTAISPASPAPQPAAKPRGRTPGPTTPAPAPSSPGPTGPSITLPQLPTPTLSPPKLSGGDWGGFAAGLLAYVLFLNYLRFGPAGVKGWFRAKFLNDPDTTLTGGLYNPGDGTPQGRPLDDVNVSAGSLTDQGLIVGPIGGRIRPRVAQLPPVQGGPSWVESR